MNTKTTLSFIGLGLIGGSIAKALKERTNHCFIKVYDQDQKTLERAKQERTADETYSCLTPSFFQCDVLFLCAPVKINCEILENYHGQFSKDCIITDVGSVKSPIHHIIDQLCLNNQFIGGHPMAGSERYGYSNSSASLLENAYYILTPTPFTKEADIQKLHTLVTLMGALPYLLTADYHDSATAAISHLPHLIASSLVNLVKKEDDSHATFKTLAAGGFKDITRIASSSPALWQQICMENREKILYYLDSYMEDLSVLRKQLDNREDSLLYNFFSSAQLYRDSFLETRSGPFIKQYVLTIDIPDKKGALAHVINLLSENDINIKNLGIVHNREEQEGALRMEFYSKPEYESALKLLKEKKITVQC